MPYLDALQWRYATKKYDATKKVPEEIITRLKESVRLTASSYGLQPYVVLDISNHELRAQLKPHTWGQTQTTDASHLWVFAAKSDLKGEYIDAFAQAKALNSGQKKDAFQGMADFIKGKVNERSPSEIVAWNTKQAYIALGSLLLAAGEEQIDATPMEGFEPEKFDELLGLKEKGLASAFVVALGYRHEEDAYQNAPKYRKSLSDLFQEV